MSTLQRILHPLVPALVGVVASATMHVGVTRAERFELPGAFCQPESDEDDINYSNHSYTTNNIAYDLVCPFLTTTDYDEVELASSEFTVRVYDGDNQDVVMVQVCRYLHQRTTGSHCAGAESTGLTDVGWATLGPSAPANSLVAHNVYFLFVQLPKTSRLHNYTASY